MNEKYTYQQATSLIREFNVTSATDYKRFRLSSPIYKACLPAQPSVYYKDEWISWDSFTGIQYKELEDNNEVDIKQLQKLAIQLNLKTKEEWQLAINTHQIDAPEHINKVVGFKNWDSLFKIEAYLKFAELLKFTRILNIKGQTDWRVWCKKNTRPQGVPFNLRKHYYDDYLQVCPEKKPSFWRYIFQGK